MIACTSPGNRLREGYKFKDVTENSKGFLLVNNDPVIWAMLNAIKEQQKMIRRQQAQIARQQQQILAQHNQVASLGSQLKSVQASLKRSRPDASDQRIAINELQV